MTENKEASWETHEERMQWQDSIYHKFIIIEGVSEMELDEWMKRNSSEDKYKYCDAFCRMKRGRLWTFYRKYILKYQI